MTRTLVALATYNEAGNVSALIEQILAYLPDAHVLVVDDNSPDGTGAIVDALSAKDARVRVLHRLGKQGLGTAILAAIQYAIDHDYSYLVNMDADLSHPPGSLPALTAGVAKYDVMIGSRYIQGGRTMDWPLSRVVLSRCVNGTVRLLFGMPVKDASGAYRCYRVSCLRATNLENMRSTGYAFLQELLFRLHCSGATMCETPIVFENRRDGVSKVNWREAIKSMGTLLWIGARYRLLGRNSVLPSAKSKRKGDCS
jgi:dolichol-phosphate mannosyltransferase